MAAAKTRTTRSVVVLKLGGELLEQPEDIQRIARGIRTLAAQASLTVVHGGGKEIDAALKAAHGEAPFVRLTGADLPEIKHVAHTNFCDIGWKVDESRRRVVLVAVIDNLVKGAAGSAVQNLNVLLGLDERTGLL